MVTESEIKINRASISYHVPSAESRFDEGGYYSRMFAEDMAKNLFPTSGMVGHKPVFRLFSDDKQISHMIETAFAHYGGFGKPEILLSSRLSAFCNQAARYLFFSGAEAFEIARTADASDQTVGFLVFRVDGVQKLAGLTWQMIPRNAIFDAPREDSQPENPRWVKIPRDRVVHIRLPREYKRIPSDLGALRNIGRPVLNFYIQNLSPDGTNQMPYDIDELQKIEQRAVASITRSTGWDGRRTFNEAVTSYYMMRRFLRFEEFKVKLREAVVDGINRILAVAEATVTDAIVEFKAEVSLHHLPTLEEIARSHNDLTTGRLGFRQLFDQYSIFRRGRVTSHE